jgi:glycosyltransferase involved in cell wall biosynthesis
VVRNGPDLSRFTEALPNLAHKRGRRYLVGYVGTMGEQEGIDILLRVAKSICVDAGRDDIGLCIIGGGPALDGLRAMSKLMGLDDVVEFTGRVSDEELLTRLSTCDVCVNPDPKTAFNDASTMTKIVDYMALRKPVVQFDVVEGRRSAGEASLYARGGDEADFAAKITQLLDDAEARHRMGELGRQRVESELEWRLQIPQLLAAYERALEKRILRKRIRAAHA